MAEDKSTPDNSSSNPIQPQPGAVISPGAVQAPPTVEAAPSPSPESVSTPESASELTSEPAAEAQPEPEEAPVAEQQSASDTTEPDLTPNGDDSQSVTWTASEFVAHDKSAGWYILLIAGTLALAVLVFFITKDVISVGVVIVAGLLLAVYGAHQPRQLEYVVNNSGIGIGQKHYSYHEFKSFSVVPEGAFSSLVFMPLKRFAVPTTVYYAPDDEDRILSILSDYLPLEEHRRDAVDSLMRRIRF
jgi:hypothetical protein